MSRASGHWQLHLTLGIHDIDRCYGREAVVGSSPAMTLGIGTTASVSGITLHDSAVDQLHQLFDQGRLQKIMAARFASRQFHRHFSVSLTTKRLINLDQILGRYFLEQIHFGYRIAGRRRIGSGSLGLMLGIGTTGHRTGYQ